MPLQEAKAYKLKRGRASQGKKDETAVILIIIVYSSVSRQSNHGSSDPVENAR